MNRVVLCTVAALLAFAANSILCRLALAGGLIDPASFTLVRLVAAALTLYFLVYLRDRNQTITSSGSWFSAAALFTYAAGFSFAYQWLDAGTGALILFASVQFSMITINLMRGQSFQLFEWAGMLIALAGFVYLVLPGVTAPPALGALLMSIAGIAWGIYSVIGKTSSNALADTMANFARALPLAVILIPFTNLPGMKVEGIIYAVASGAIASGIGYAIWYKVLPQLSASVSAVSQLSVPLIATLGGILLLGEKLDPPLVVSTIVILSGIGIVIQAQRRK